MKLYIVVKYVPTRFARLKNEDVPLNELLSLCDTLSEATSIRGVALHSYMLKKELEELEVIKTNMRGISYPGPKFNEFYEMVVEEWNKN